MHKANFGGPGFKLQDGTTVDRSGRLQKLADLLGNLQKRGVVNVVMTFNTKGPLPLLNLLRHVDLDQSRPY